VRILITGADGLLARQMCKQLSSTHSITGIVHRPVETPVPGVEYLNLDLSKPLDYSLLPKSVDAIFHLAQSSRFRDFPDGAKDTFAVNVESTIDLLDYARLSNVSKFFLASTGGVYGVANTPITESSDLMPPTEIGFYFASKLASEMLCTSYRSIFDVTVLRFFFMYGPGQRADMFLPRLVHRIMNGESISLNGKNGIQVNPIHVSDAAYLMGQLLGKPNSPLLNVSGPDIVSIRQIAELIGDATGIRPKFESASTGQDVLASNSSIQDYFLSRKMTSFVDGLQSLVGSIVKN
jgi:nucleoside-diphosphate-sugar epimerase